MYKAQNISITLASNNLNTLSNSKKYNANINDISQERASVASKINTKLNRYNSQKDLNVHKSVVKRSTTRMVDQDSASHNQTILSNKQVTSTKIKNLHADRVRRANFNVPVVKKTLQIAPFYGGVESGTNSNLISLRTQNRSN